jgi:hypothetical protein
MISATLIATTGERLTRFAPYVASVNDAGTVAFQATLRDGGSGVFTGNGGALAHVSETALLAAVTSHPDLNDAGETTFYADLASGGQGVFLLSEGELRTIADTRAGFASIGPLGPTMNQTGTVAFRANPTPSISGIFAGDGSATATVADTRRHWTIFHGLPVIDARGVVVFRADRKDGVAGIYAWDAGSIRTVAETGDLFSTLGHFPSLNNQGAVAFAATQDDGRSGVFVADGEHIRPIIDTSSAFGSFRGALLTDAGDVVLIATPRGGRLGIFAGPDPVADRILCLGDPLLGSNVVDLASNPVSVNAVGQVAIRAALADGRELILRADTAPASASSLSGTPNM